MMAWQSTSRPPIATMASKLEALSIGLGVGWSLAFVLVGPSFNLQLYGDGSLFAYAVAATDSWAFHWHNISGRLFVYLVAHMLPEAYITATGDARGGIALYGILFYSAPALGLVATRFVDRSPGNFLFATACASVACLCPLIFGFPTEMWVAHSVFWPTLAACHYARWNIGGHALVAGGLTALMHTHGGGVVLAGVAVATTMLRRGGDGRPFRRACAAALSGAAILAVTLTVMRPDEHIKSVIDRAAFNFIDPINFWTPIIGLIAYALTIHSVFTATFTLCEVPKAGLKAAIVVLIVLVGYWAIFDYSLHAEYRYWLRTALLYLTPVAAFIAIAGSLHANCELRLPAKYVGRVGQVLRAPRAAQHLAWSLAIVTLVHAVETAKFVRGWSSYLRAVEQLASGTASDPSLGDPRFVSSNRIDGPQTVGWSSTVHFLSVLAAPDMSPKHLVVSPAPAYDWLSCKTATANAQAERALSGAGRQLIREHACLRRPPSDE